MVRLVSLSLLAAVAAPVPARAATFVVTGTGDSGAGTLRQAILDANASPGADTIHFAFPEAGPHAIVPLSALPVVTGPVTIDGATQPGIELVGASAPTASGLDIAGGGSTVRALTVRGFSSGIVLSGAGGNTITGCSALGNTFHGIRVALGAANTLSGNLLAGNGNFGISLAAGTDATVVTGNRVGLPGQPNGTGIFLEGQSGNAGSNRIAGNVVAGNTGDGISLGGTTAGHVVQGNLVEGNGGTGLMVHFGSCCNLLGGPATADGNVVRGNGGSGIRSDYHPNTIQRNVVAGNTLHGVHVNLMSANTVRENTVTGNGGTGVVVTGLANLVSVNAVAGNGGLAIDLGLDGVDVNDPGDHDTGPNGRQNHPLLASASTGATGTHLTGSLATTPNTTFRLEFFSSPSCDPSGHGEGAVFLGSANATTDVAGNAAFAVDLPATAAGVVSAVAIHPTAGTSEMSPCRAVICGASLPPAVSGLRVERTLLSWTALAAAAAYEVVVGDLQALRASGGDFAAGTSCIAGSASGHELLHLDLPAAGTGFWLLVRATSCGGPGSFDTGSPAQQGSRDAEVEASPSSCP